ncbi:MAG: SoxR reducing system RseC family protein [Nitrosomonadales bacterium]|nr:SoxR reducing system RseC family protein [Nitrosomonadales bacterium]
MLETRAIIVRVEGRYALVRANQGNGCEQCNGKGCGTGKLSQMFCSKPRQFRVDNPIHAGVGDEVVISVVEGAVLRGIGLVYLLPLLLLVVGAALASMGVEQPSQRDGYAAAGAMLGLIAGFVVARWIASRQANSRPYVARPWREE